MINNLNQDGHVLNFFLILCKKQLRKYSGSAQPRKKCTMRKPVVFTARVRSTREGNVLTSVCPSIHPSVCPQGGVPISHNALQHFPECHEAVGRGVPDPGTPPPRGVPGSGTPPWGGTRVRYPPPRGVPGSGTPRGGGGTQVRYPPLGVGGSGTPPGGEGGYPGQVPPGGYPGQVPPPGGYPGQVPPPGGGGYPGQVPPGGSGTPPGRYPGQVPPRGVPGSGTPPGGYPGQVPPLGGTRVRYPPPPGGGTRTPPGGGYPGRTTEGVLTTRRAVCLLRSRRRTFLLIFRFGQKSNQCYHEFRKKKGFLLE